jgi:hypothetical protein
MTFQRPASYLGFLFLAAALGVAGDAEAAAVTHSACTVINVFVDGTTTLTRLKIIANCTGASNFSHYAYAGYACTPSSVNKSSSILTEWRSLAVSAMLSGKQLAIVYDDATGGGCTNGIYSVEMY